MSTRTVHKPDRRDRVDEAVTRRLKSLISGKVKLSYHDQADARCYHAEADARCDRRHITGKGPDAQTAHNDLLAALKLNKGTAAREQAHQRQLDAQVNETMARLGIPSNPIPPLCTPDNPCPSFDERHLAMFDRCYFIDSSGQTRIMDGAR